ncbi:hypothetical protein J3R30DRAFT_3710869 [Lentinula aciculospora]|uniref:Uncharacterized protein n=1 Tax=Lentinula aciculospora TaxID=153920 RepID=A0A9W8ZZH5_9AGAR|nr:hypothetical protein J3R30DRAFT_3710869 [Lentinula aciculospora]
MRTCSTIIPFITLAIVGVAHALPTAYSSSGDSHGHGNDYGSTPRDDVDSDLVEAQSSISDNSLRSRSMRMGLGIAAVASVALAGGITAITMGHPRGQESGEGNATSTAEPTPTTTAECEVASAASRRKRDEEERHHHRHC